MSEQRRDWPVFGHYLAVEILSRAARGGQIGHAYLLSGPEGIGKSTLARTFAQALVCTAEPAERPCGRCSACTRAQRGIHPDVSLVNLETQAAGDQKDRKNTRISIETIRELRGSIALRPMEARWRVAIIEDADLLSRDAFDALLKTLEEPPPFVVLILIATEIDAIPETIRSRCLPVTLDGLPRKEVAAVLQARGLEPAQAEAVASITRGRIGHALTLASDSRALLARREELEAALEMIENPLVAVGAARRMADQFRRGQRDHVETQIDTLIGVWRDLVLVTSGCGEQVVNADARDRLERLSRCWSLGEVHLGLKATYQALIDLGANAQPRLVLDHMVLQWPRSE